MKIKLIKVLTVWQHLDAAYFLTCLNGLLLPTQMHMFKTSVFGIWLHNISCKQEKKRSPTATLQKIS